MDWKLCIICQTKTGEPLQCPAISKRKDVGASYSSFARNLEEFQKIGSVPVRLNVEELDDGQGIESSIGDGGCDAVFQTAPQKSRHPYTTIRF